MIAGFQPNGDVMEKVPEREPRTLSRRAMVTTGAAVGAGAWVAPSILTYDRAYAAIGSCGTKPVQVTWSPWAGNKIPLDPSTITAADGVEVTCTISDPFNVQSSTWDMRVFNGTINGRQNPVITGMSDATNGQGVTITFTFSTPVQPSFFVIDCDRGPSVWEDRVEVLGYLAGGSPIDPDSITLGGSAVTVVNPNTVRGTSSSTSSNSEAEYDFQEPVDTITIRHYDDKTWTGFQWVGISDLSWC